MGESDVRNREARAGVAVMPLVIVAVAVAYVASARLTPTPAPAANTAARDGSPATTPPLRTPETEPGTAAHGIPPDDSAAR